jgi:hypothetical protein
VSERLHRAYTTVALHWLNATLLFVAVIAASAIVVAIADAVRPSYTWRYNPLALKRSTAAQAREIFADFGELNGTIGLTYRPWVGLSEREVHYARVNVDAAEPLPVRRTPAVAASNDGAEVWLFGGSTTFGIGVPDDQTIAAHLQRALAAAYPGRSIRVLNCGHLRYYSSQELALFAWMLRRGRAPRLAVFIDGLNDSWHLQDVPDYSDDIARAFHSYGEQPAVTVSQRVGVVRLVRKLLGRGPRSEFASIEKMPAAEAARLAPQIGERYLTNVRLARALASAAGAQTLFVWQPTPFDFMEQPDGPLVHRTRSAWPSNALTEPLNAWIARRASGEQLAFLADAFASRRFLDTYVDSCHYGDEASEVLARRIAEKIVAANAL